MYVMLKDILSTESRHGLEREHPMSSFTLKLTSVYEELYAHKNNGGDFQITGTSVPLDHGTQLLR